MAKKEVKEQNVAPGRPPRPSAVSVQPVDTDVNGSPIRPPGISPVASGTRSARKKKKQAIEEKQTSTQETATPSKTETATKAVQSSTPRRAANTAKKTTTASSTRTPLKRSARKTRSSSVTKQEEKKAIQEEEAEDAAKESRLTSELQNEQQETSVSDPLQKDPSTVATPKKKTKTTATVPKTPKTKTTTEKKTKQKTKQPQPPQQKKQVDSNPSVSNKKQDKVKRSSKKKRKASRDLSGEESSSAPITSTPQVDVTVHRMRFLAYQPKPIICLAPTPSPMGSTTVADYIALSRDNGTVELQSVDEKFRTVATVAGLSSRPVNVMAWICGGCGDSTSNTTKPSSSNNNKASYYSSYHKSHTHHHGCRTLVGASNDGTIFVIDFAHGRQTSVIGSGGGAVLSLVSLCSTGACGCCRITTNDSGGGDKNQSNNNKCMQLIAAGCEDGSVRIYRLVTATTEGNEDEKRLELVSTIACAGSAILSLAWRRLSGTSSTGMKGTVLFAGVADGTIRRYDCVASPLPSSSMAMSTNTILDGGDGDIAMGDTSATNCSWKSNLRMTVECLGRNTPTRVWTLQALADGTVVSGDSLGHVQFWDGHTGTLQQSFDQNDNKADVLAVVVGGGHDENRVFASGIDSRVVCIERSTNTNNSKWIMTHAQRPHTHDVKALAICRSRDVTGTMSPPTANQQQQQQVPQEREILCTGGVDTKLCTYRVKDFRKVRPKILYPWPDVSPIAVATKARIVALRREDRIDLYQLGPRSTSTSVDAAPVLLPEDKTLVGTLEIKGGHNFTCSDINQDGSLLAISDAVGLLLFRLSYEENSQDGTKTVTPEQINLPTDIRWPCMAVKFASNNRLVCATASDDSIHLVGITNDSDGEEKGTKVHVEHTFHLGESESNKDALLFPIHTLQVSNDGEWLAAVRNGLAKGATQIFAIPSEGGTCQHWWDVPALEAPHTSVAFVANGTSASPQLAVCCTNFAFYIFDVQQKSLNPWSEQSGFPITPKLPMEMTSRNDYPVRIGCNKATPGKFLFGSFGAFCAVDLDKPLPRQCRSFPERHVRTKRRKRSKSMSEQPEGSETNGDHVDNCIICLRYNSMLYMDFIEDNEMLVVEQPWLSVVASFPEALERKMYGT